MTSNQSPDFLIYLRLAVFDCKALCMRTFITVSLLIQPLSRVVG
jgi:hypothetical protein